MISLVRYPVVTVFLTRKCSLRCRHCLIWKTHRLEIPPEKWKKIMNAWYNTLTEFIVILGGEPLEYWKPFEGLLEIIKGIKETEYAISSNSILLSWNRAKKLVEVGLKNWTVSIDYPKSMSKGDIRALAGWRAIEWFKKLGVPDLHATITLYPENVKYFPQIVTDLMEMEVWIEPTFAMWAKASWYDSFPAHVKPVWSEDHIEYISRGIKLLKNYKYFHGIPRMFEGKGLNEMLNATMTCERLYVPTIDEDGFMRLCRDIPGNNVRRWYAIDVLENIDGFEKDWSMDKECFCRGCNWDCVWHVKNGFQKFIHKGV